MDFELSELLQGQAMQTWIRIMQWVWVFAIAWISFMLLRNGFDDLNDIIRSRYATQAERWQARTKRVTRVLALMGAALFGATSFALPFWFQGAILIFFWGQMTGG